MAEAIMVRGEKEGDFAEVTLDEAQHGVHCHENKALRQ